MNNNAAKFPLFTQSYDYNLEKVKLFTRIPLGDITKITKGIYILSPLEEASRNSDDNFGFLISYLPSGLTTRVTSYSVRNTRSRRAQARAALLSLLHSRRSRLSISKVHRTSRIQLRRRQLAATL
ncbi:hypothetical protein JB92DRAFT_633263 [Gautieria morchelliformis]|nr:hypothetical protein JB92DRAFT_633263 [Gautieria morchelliformis]